MIGAMDGLRRLVQTDLMAISAATTIKICGLTDAASLDAALDAGVDFVGLVAFPPSPRHLDLDSAAALADRARGRAGIVVLTVDAADDLIEGIAATIRPDMIQLHGSESPERADSIRAASGLPVVKAVGVAGAADLAHAAGFGSADRLILDAKPPRDSTRPGGNGRAFDWSLLAGFAPGRPWLLSGGLDADNVAAALAISGAPGVDVSSGVETTPGRKSPDLIRAFVAAVRQAGSQAPALRRAG